MNSQGWQADFKRAQAVTHLVINSREYDRLSYGDEEEPLQHPKCDDCGVPRGSLHLLGCDLEQCPRCMDKLFPATASSTSAPDRHHSNDNTHSVKPCVKWILRATHTARLSRSLQPPSPRQAPRQSRGLLALLDARTRTLRSKRRSGHRKSLNNRKHFGGKFIYARQPTRQPNGSIWILRHESALHSTSLASEFQFGRNG